MTDARAALAKTRVAMAAILRRGLKRPLSSQINRYRRAIWKPRRPEWMEAKAGAAAAVLAFCAAFWLTACTSDRPDPIFLQLRWCVMEGSSETGGAKPGDLVTTHGPDGEALLRANDIWPPGAGVGLFSVVVERGGVKGIPMIRDPDMFQDPAENTGDIDAPGGDPFESQQAALECHRAWRALDPEMEGPVVVTVRRFVHAGQTLAGASRPANDFWVSPAPGDNQRGDDLCGEPRHLSSEDVFEIDGSSSTHNDVGWVIISQPDQFSNLDHRARSLAHELGHVLSLGHGNGIDDNSDGEQVGVPGPRRFDQYCDALGSTTENGINVPKEDLGSPGLECKSLMHGNASCPELTALQVEQARAAASVMPGCNGRPCKK